jgi:lipoprotein-anchoring transpeptidase ErfK/SrfK
MNRRTFLLGAPLLLAGCGRASTYSFSLPDFTIGAYGGGYDNGFPISAVDRMRINPALMRQEVAYDGPQRAGTIIINPSQHYLYLVEGDGRAVRYGVGVGREGFAWSGVARVGRKQVWPTWTPPAEMQRRQPESAEYADGMPGGPGNPLGARALYLYQGKRDTMYRIHGTNDPSSIGRSMSSGCIRLLNQDIIDLYERVPIGTRVVVLAAGEADV